MKVPVPSRVALARVSLIRKVHDAESSPVGGERILTMTRRSDCSGRLWRTARWCRQDGTVESTRARTPREKVLETRWSRCAFTENRKGAAGRLFPVRHTRTPMIVRSDSSGGGQIRHVPVRGCASFWRWVSPPLVIRRPCRNPLILGHRRARALGVRIDAVGWQKETTANG